MSNDFEKIQQIYEEGFRGQYAQLRNYGPNLKYTPGEAPPGYTLTNTPGHLPFQNPYSGYQRPAGGEGALQGITAPIDEEIKAVQILNKDVIQKIEELQEEADEDGMGYANILLGRLKEYIKDDLTPKGTP